MSILPGSRRPFFPKADAAVLFSKHDTPQTRPQVIGPVYDPSGASKPIEEWSDETAQCFYPQSAESYAPAPIPAQPIACASDRYLRASLAKNERLRLSMLWYYTRNILGEHEFLSGLQQKVHLAMESTEWEFAIIGILDLHVYIRLATIGVPLGILPRGETLCAHTVTQPPGCVFLLPSMLEDWRFQTSPYVESGGLKAYAGSPLRLQNEAGECVALGSLCVASSSPQKPLTKTQQQTLVHLADWVVSDIVQCARARRQRERRRMTDLLSEAQKELETEISEEPVLRMLKTVYPESTVALKSSEVASFEVEGRDPIKLSDFEDGLWEDTEYIDDIITNFNHKDSPNDRIVRAIAVPCESMSRASVLVVASKDLRLVFDDIDLWFVQACTTMLSHMWHKCLLTEAMSAKEKFLRGVSHQLRTPIHGILGSVELLAEELKTWEKLLETASAINSNGSSVYLDTIKMSGQDLISIVNSMITLNSWADIAMKDRNYTTQPIHELEADLANESLKAPSRDAHHNTSLIFRHILPPGCNSLRTDYTLLQSSLQPIITNAIQNTPNGVVAVTISIASDGGNLVVDIEDNGRGISPDHHQRIFEPHEKVGVHSTGAGLGLTLASRFATLLKGSVTLVSSEIGHGSHFRATLRDVECVYSPDSLPPLVPKLDNLPSTFHHMASSSGSKSLNHHFAAILGLLGFTPSDSLDKSFMIFDFQSDPEAHQNQLNRIPSGQIAICLVPASDKESRMKSTDNVIYIEGPFLSSKLASALVEADKLASLKASAPLPVITSAESPPAQPLTTNDPNTIEEAQPLSDLTQTTEQLDQQQPDRPKDETEFPKPPTIKLTEVVQAEVSRTVSIPILPTLKVAPRPKALLVDDNNINLRIMQMYCSKRGLPYSCAMDGKQAVDLFLQEQSLAATGQGSPFQLILMDLQMPVCDGLEATRQIRNLERDNSWHKSAIFIVTGQDTPADRTAADAAGAEEYLVKPVSMKTLDRSVVRYFPGFQST
ncbi:histidine kinase HHK3 [Paramyrothecium foliicola]|nr:histidine kinase HHK3 [Paramyrothecium foliicola]